MRTSKPKEQSRNGQEQRQETEKYKITAGTSKPSIVISHSTEDISEIIPEREETEGEIEKPKKKGGMIKSTRKSGERSIHGLGVLATTKLAVYPVIIHFDALLLILKGMREVIFIREISRKLKKHRK